MFEFQKVGDNRINAVHIQEGHRYMFQVVQTEDGRRVLDTSYHCRGHEAADHEPDYFTGEARVFAEREGKHGSMID